MLNNIFSALMFGELSFFKARRRKFPASPDQLSLFDGAGSQQTKPTNSTVPKVAHPTAMTKEKQPKMNTSVSVRDFTQQLKAPISDEQDKRFWDVYNGANGIETEMNPNRNWQKRQKHNRPLFSIHPKHAPEDQYGLHESYLTDEQKDSMHSILEDFPRYMQNYHEGHGSINDMLHKYTPEELDRRLDEAEKTVRGLHQSRHQFLDKIGVPHHQRRVTYWDTSSQDNPFAIKKDHNGDIRKSLVAIMFGEVMPFEIGLLSKAARKTKQPRGQDGRFILTTLKGAAKNFSSLIDRTLTHEETGVHWRVKPSDFIRIVFEKNDSYKNKADCNSEEEANELYEAALRGDRWVQDIKGFRKDRAGLVKLLPDIVESPDVIAIGKKQTDDQGSIIIIKNLGIKQTPILVKIPKDKGKRKTYIENIDNLEVIPISNHTARLNSVKSLLKRRYKVIWHKKSTLFLEE